MKAILIPLFLASIAFHAAEMRAKFDSILADTKIMGKLLAGDDRLAEPSRRGYLDAGVLELTNRAGWL